MDYEKLREEIKWFKYDYKGYESKEIVRASDFADLFERVNKNVG